MELIIWDWASFALRWLHVVTVIAWIGSSFYFVMVDLGLRPAERAPKGVGGETWQVHGGGFYHLQKYLVAPEGLPRDVTWFKWESYGTWLSGFFLLCVIYYAGADLYLIDPAVLNVSRGGAIAISLAALASGWLVYDLLCKSPIGKNTAPLAIAVYALLVAEAYALTHVFSGRGAFVHIGAIIATIMTANVFFIILPNQKKVVAALMQGETPDPALGKQAKQRSTHNNYLTLPVVFLMLSGHYPLAFATQFNWVIVALVILIGGVIRHFFNTMHQHKSPPWWTWGVAAILFAIVIWLSSFPAASLDAKRAARAPSRQVAAAMAAPHFADARDVVIQRCSMCHAQTPAWEGLPAPPKGVRFDEDRLIAQQAGLIELQAVRSRAMPPRGVSHIVDLPEADRRILAAWLAAIPASAKN
jgi:uncharacterized membrane protein